MYIFIFLFDILVITEKLNSSKKFSINTKLSKPTETETNNTNNEYLLSLQVCICIVHIFTFYLNIL